jgi:hypothetical protein
LEGGPIVENLEVVFLNPRLDRIIRIPERPQQGLQLRCERERSLDRVEDLELP